MDGPMADDSRFLFGARVASSPLPAAAPFPPSAVDLEAPALNGAAASLRQARAYTLHPTQSARPLPCRSRPGLRAAIVRFQKAQVDQCARSVLSLLWSSIVRPTPGRAELRSHDSTAYTWVD